MGARFKTDQQIEIDLLEEARALPMLCGRNLIVRNYRLNWRVFDSVVKHRAATVAEIAEALDYQAEMKKLLPGQVLGEVLMPLREKANKILEHKRAAIAKRKALQQKLKLDFRDAAQYRNPPGSSK
jgi:hypothetical protein